MSRTADNPSRRSPVTLESLDLAARPTETSPRTQMIAAGLTAIVLAMSAIAGLLYGPKWAEVVGAFGALPLLLCVPRLALYLSAALLPYPIGASSAIGAKLNFPIAEFLMFVGLAGTVVQGASQSRRVPSGGITSPSGERRTNMRVIALCTAPYALVGLAGALHSTNAAAVFFRLSERLILLVAIPAACGACLYKSGLLKRYAQIFVASTALSAVLWVAVGNGQAALGVDKNPAGQFLATSILLLLFTDVARRLRWPLILLQLGGLAATQSRGAVLGLAVGIVVVIALSPRRSRALIAAGALAVVAASLLVVYPQAIVGRFLNESGDSLATANQRTLFRNDALTQYHATAPWGVGIGSYHAQDQALQNVATPDPHNVLVFCLVEGGVALLIAFIIMVLGPAIYLFFKARIRSLVAVTLAVQASVMAHSMVDVYWVRNTPDAGWILVGAALAAAAATRSGQRPVGALTFPYPAIVQSRPTPATFNAGPVSRSRLVVDE